MVQYLPDPNFIPILFFFFSLFGSFFFLFCPPLTFPLPSFFFSFSYSFPIPFLLLVSFFSSPFCCFSFSLSSLSSFLPPPCPNACPTPPLLLKKILGRTLHICNISYVIICNWFNFCTYPVIFNNNRIRISFSSEFSSATSVTTTFKALPLILIEGSSLSLPLSSLYMRIKQSYKLMRIFFLWLIHTWIQFHLYHPFSQ